MTDDLTKKKKDSHEININQGWEVRDWSKALGITKEELIDAVKAVGPWADDVKEYLSKR